MVSSLGDHREAGRRVTFIAFLIIRARLLTRGDTSFRSTDGGNNTLQPDEDFLMEPSAKSLANCCLEITTRIVLPPRDSGPCS